MGILNLTPDSFFDGGQYKGTKSILEQIINLFCIICFSTRYILILFFSKEKHLSEIRSHDILTSIQTSEKLPVPSISEFFSGAL